MAEVSFCVVGRTQVHPSKFTTAYESVVVRCRAVRGLEPAERMQALRLDIAADSRGSLLRFPRHSFPTESASGNGRRSPLEYRKFSAAAGNADRYGLRPSLFSSVQTESVRRT